MSASPDVDGVLIQTASWTRAGATFAYDSKTKTFTDTGAQSDRDLRQRARLRVDRGRGHEPRRRVKVPLSIIYKSGIKLDGQNPTLLSGYGSYGLSQNVSFSPTRLAWLERGGVHRGSRMCAAAASWARTGISPG